MHCCVRCIERAWKLPECVHSSKALIVHDIFRRHLRQSIGSSVDHQVQICERFKCIQQAIPCFLRCCGRVLQADIAVLEEPEHLNWYHHGRRWTEKFNHVVGVMHTNYLDYAKREEHGVVKSAALAVINHLMCRLHCHKVRIRQEHPSLVTWQCLSKGCSSKHGRLMRAQRVRPLLAGRHV